ncbi:MAG: hypothetical protein SNJ71_08430, partial [Bacteroidales bacterium]
MKKIVKTAAILSIVTVTFFSCRKEKIEPLQVEQTNTGTVKEENKPVKTTVNGLVQKGPFISGSSITLYELSNSFTASGKSFNTQITDNSGSFQISDIELSSNYVNMRADGFYFNEVTGKQSNSQITLYAIAGIGTNINVNCITHLEKPRIEYLIKNGMSFSEAKTKAQQEVLKIFGIEKQNVSVSELLTICNTGDDNAILLAVSCILQGVRTESELSEL